MRSPEKIRSEIDRVNRQHNARLLVRIQQAFATSTTSPRHPYTAEVEAWHRDLWPLTDDLGEAEFQRQMFLMERRGAY